MAIDSFPIYENTEIFHIKDKGTNNSISLCKDNPCYQFELPTRKTKSCTKTSCKWKQTCVGSLILTTIASMASTATLVITQYINEPKDSSATSSYCLNNGVYVLNSSNFMECRCVDGYWGTRCEGNPCSSNPCMYNGTCFVYGNNSRCSCSKGYQGLFCEVTPCDSSPCLNGASCRVFKEQYECVCPLGYYGNQCHVTPCDGVKCSNGGLCTVTDDMYNCECPPGYNGSFCQVTQCSSLPCQNNGQCIEINETYGCLCEVGFSGPNCQGCSRIPCLNGGTCHVEADGYNCSCRSGYYGVDCKIGEYFYQTIESPGFASAYSNSITRTWAINVGIGNSVSIRFANFSTEACCDFLEIFNGGTPCASRLAKLSGTTLPEEIKTCGHEAYLQFKTDGSVTSYGFRANVYNISVDI